MKLTLPPVRGWHLGVRGAEQREHLRRPRREQAADPGKCTPARAHLVWSALNEMPRRPLGIAGALATVTAKQPAARRHNVITGRGRESSLARRGRAPAHMKKMNQNRTAGGW
jgi:hypothetical protein